MTRKVAVVVGSIRKDSINRKLAKALVNAPKDFECDFVTRVSRRSRCGESGSLFTPY